MKNHPASACCVNCGAPLQNINLNPNAKSKIAAGLLAILIGVFGVHNFYLGYTGKAVAQLLITILSFGILSWVSLIWSVIEGVQILTGTIAFDANGVPLKD
ncbi:MAG: TM2 domain-containing protein [Clostridiales bacterium]|nr:TM2 domain-containing protein [Clostridiales bacterium]